MKGGRLKDIIGNKCQIKLMVAHKLLNKLKKIKKDILKNMIKNWVH